MKNCVTLCELLCIFVLVFQIKAAVINNDLINEQNLQDLSAHNDPVMVCYYTDWSPHRPGKAHFEPKDIDYELCTHIIYVFALLDETLDKIVPEEPELDIEQDNYGKVTSLKKFGKKVLLGMGGWVDSTPKYRTMLRYPDIRKKLVLQITDFIIKYNFDGLEVDILFPGVYQGNFESGTPQDKQYFLAFLRELRDSFDSKTKELGKQRLLLSMVVGTDEKIVNAAYQTPEIFAVCDFVEVFVQNLHNHYRNRTTLVAPLTQPRDDKFQDTKFDYVENAMDLWISRGAPANKLVIGFASFGRTYKLKDSSLHDINAPTEGFPDKAEYTEYVSYISYYEILERISKGGWAVVHKENLGSYAYKGDQWMAFDDKRDVAVKAEYVKQRKFLGASLWSLELDCFQEDCPAGRYPLLSTIRNVLLSKLNPNEVKNEV